MISIDRKAKDIEVVVQEVLKRKDQINSFIVITFDHVTDAVLIQYAAHWHHLGVAASLCQSEFNQCYEGENTRD